MTLDVNGKNYNVTGQGQGNLNTVWSTRYGFFPGI